MKGILST